jgi:hypothetical protein
MISNKIGQAGIYMMVIGLSVSSLCFVGAFIKEDALPLGAQVACHIGFFIFPLAIKLGYVFKLIANNQLNKALANG